METKYDFRKFQCSLIPHCPWPRTGLLRGMTSIGYSQAWFNYYLVLEGAQAACSGLAGQAGDQDC